MEHQPGVWLSVKLRRVGPSILRIETWCKLGIDPARVPSSARIFGTALGVLNYVLGGGADPERIRHEKERACAKPESHILRVVAGGTEEVLEVWPFVAHADAAREVWQDAWPRLAHELRALGGALGRLTEGETEEGLWMTFEYGPGVILLAPILQAAGGLGGELSVSGGHVVDMGEVTLRPGAGFAGAIGKEERR